MAEGATAAPQPDQWEFITPEGDGDARAAAVATAGLPATRPVRPVPRPGPGEFGLCLAVVIGATLAAAFGNYDPALYTAALAPADPALFVSSTACAAAAGVTAAVRLTRVPSVADPAARGRAATRRIRLTGVAVGCLRAFPIRPARRTAPDAFALPPSAPGSMQPVPAATMRPVRPEQAPQIPPPPQIPPQPPQEPASPAAPNAG